MNRRTFVASVTAVLAAPFTGEAQQAGMVHRIGFLSAPIADPLVGV
jgi:hypothetical protein